MVFKLNISEKGKAWKLENDSEDWIGKKIGEKVSGKEISADLEGYSLEITGTSDNAGFPGKKDEEGFAMKGILLTKGWGMHTKPKGLRKHPIKKVPQGMRLKKTVRGNTISKDTAQINLKVLKSGSKKLEQVFPEQNQPKKKEEKPAESPAQ